MKNIIWLVVVLLVAAGVYLFTANGGDAQAQTAAFRNISPQEVKAKIENKEDIVLLDVRTPGEFNGPLGHIDNAILIPVQELGSRIDELAPYKDKEIIVYCRSGNRSRAATKILLKNGFNAVNMTRGMQGWNQLSK
ncbi:MAG TPA: rhodanese-like domain-containing protein [Caldithrix abyssi]|uniref:Rhodanese-like domain-containing protein n=1 Tax=Caldithrix abyssi TaxID=187145 RepID=A0A7V1LNW4_CALAY|nr:rhodanese-like domain-containing protein [Caldithrix abyssi]